MFISSLVVRASKTNILVSLAVFLLLFPVQGMLAYEDSLPAAIRGIHGFTGMLIMGGSYGLATSKIKATNYQEKKVLESAQSGQLPEAPAA